MIEISNVNKNNFIVKPSDQFVNNSLYMKNMPPPNAENAYK